MPKLLLSLLLLLGRRSLVVVATTGEFGFTNDTIGAAYEYFELSATNGAATIECINPGSRCVFQRDDYQNYNFGSGQETDTAQGATWAALNPKDDVLTLDTCVVDADATATSRKSGTVFDQCLVVCNANCTCGYSDGTPCNHSDQPPAVNDITATTAPAAPKHTSCPQQMFTEHCSALMNDPKALPPGLEENYDCYNFCNGTFVSSCDLQSGNCGSLSCEDGTEDGTVTGRVQGCTAMDRIPNVNPPAMNNMTATVAPAPHNNTTCPQQMFTEYCPVLMNDPKALPPEVNSMYDCYDFCNGRFTSLCSLLSGDCGVSFCANAAADGTIAGRVQGCTPKDLIQNTTTNGANNSSDGSTNDPPTMNNITPTTASVSNDLIQNATTNGTNNSNDGFTNDPLAVNNMTATAAPAPTKRIENTTNGQSNRIEGITNGNVSAVARMYANLGYVASFIVLVATGMIL